MSPQQPPPDGKCSKERMLRRMVLFYEFGAGRPGYTLPRSIRHTKSYSGWTPAELDELYQEMIQRPWAQSILAPEAPEGR